MFDWWRRIIRAGGPRAVRAAASASRLGECHWLIVPPLWKSDVLDYGAAGEPWLGRICQVLDSYYCVRPENAADPSSDFVLVREDQLFPTAEAARDAYIGAMEAKVTSLDPSRREPVESDQRRGIPRRRPLAVPDRGEPAAAAPAVGGRYWLIAPVHDALNLGFGVWEPWTGIVVEIRGNAYRVVPEADLGLGGVDPGPLVFWRDACVGIAGLHETEDDAWDAFHEVEAEKEAEARRAWIRWSEELSKWVRAREDGLARPPRGE